MKTRFLLPLLVLLSMAACKTETEVIKEPSVNAYIYDVDAEDLYQSNAEKNKQKSAEQYISILYANLFQSTVPQGDLADLGEIRKAIGDKQMADELILNAFVNDGSVSIPSNAEMRADIEAFVQETYLRFFLREPTAYEIFELKAEIEEDPDLTPELIYQAFALSNEYKFY